MCWLSCPGQQTYVNEMHSSFVVFIGKVLIPLSPKGTTGPYTCAFYRHGQLNISHHRQSVVTLLS